MATPHPSSQALSKSISTRREDPNASSDTGVFYVGLGDRFDDDRRLVRDTESVALLPAFDASGRQVGSL